MLGWFRFKVHKANYPDGQIWLAEKSGSNVALIDERLAAKAIFYEPMEGIQNAGLAFVARERLIHSNQGILNLSEKSGDNITAVSTMQTLRVIFSYWDAYRFTDIPPAIRKLSIWVAFLRSLGAAIRSATTA